MSSPIDRDKQTQLLNEEIPEKSVSSQPSELKEEQPQSSKKKDVSPQGENIKDKVTQQQQQQQQPAPLIKPIPQLATTNNTSTVNSQKQTLPESKPTNIESKSLSSLSPPPPPSLSSSSSSSETHKR
jgi:hypothetical protein